MNTILHICSSYSKQKLWPILAQSLEKHLAIKQEWYIPVRTRNELGAHDCSGEHIKVSYKRVIRRHHKVLFYLRAWKTFKWISQEMGDTSDSPTKVHAHFLFTDGAVALFLHWKKRVPYVVSVRNTDINTYFRFALHLKWFAKLILSSAESIVLVSPSYKRKLRTAVGATFFQTIEHKLLVVPNQLQQSWFDIRPPQTTNGPITLLYVGDNTPNKRFTILVELLKILPERFQATFVGIEAEDLAIPADLAHRIQIVGRVNCEEQLMDFYEQCHILVLPSKHETFGMVAAEALALGRPVLISKGEGISGFLEEQMPLSCTNFLNYTQTVRAILEIVEHYPTQIRKSFDVAKTFSEDVVMEKYRKIYLNNELRT